MHVLRASDNVPSNTSSDFSLKISRRAKNSYHVSPFILLSKKFDLLTHLFILLCQGILQHVISRKILKLIPRHVGLLGNRSPVAIAIPYDSADAQKAFQPHDIEHQLALEISQLYSVVF